MNFESPTEKIYSRIRINEVKKYCHLIDIGSEVNCYNLTSRQVIKIFNPELVKYDTKLFIPDSIYGNNTYIFIDEIIRCCNQIVAYTMKYVRGPNLSIKDSVILFYNLSYSMLLEYITILVQDSKKLANHGIQVFDCFKTNIILSPTGFRQIDCVDFKPQDMDQSIIEKENIRLMCQTIYDCLIAPYLSTFISNINLKPDEFTESPVEFIKELRVKSQEYSDTEIITIGDTKKLVRKR